MLSVEVIHLLDGRPLAKQRRDPWHYSTYVGGVSAVS
jgi:hypothetical protein